MESQIHAFKELLNKWLNGSFRATDGRTMDKIAAQDLDIREAMDGYTAHPEHDHAASLARLRKRLPIHEQPKPFFHTAYGKFSLAAASLVLLFSAWWFLQPVPQEQPSLVHEETATKATEIATEPTLVAVTEPQTAAEVVEKPQASNQNLAQDARAKRNPVSPRAADAQSAGGTAQQPNTTTTSRVAADMAVTSGPEPEAVGITTYATKAEAPEPIQEEIQTQSAARAKQSAPASTAPVAAAKRKASPTFETDKKVSAEADKELVLEPNGGWTSWDLYLMNALVYPKEAAERRVTGNVRLTFWIDNNGRPTQIKVARSLGTACDEEAVRLLMEGPDWAPSGSKYGAVEIKFPR
jgi:TonB family protein